MKECTTKKTQDERANGDEVAIQAESGVDYGGYIGLDVHKETIAVAVARVGREVAEYRGEIANNPKAVKKLVDRLNKVFGGEVLLFCYEAGPCGYVLLVSAGKSTQQTTVAIARELVGFIWDIARHEMPKVQPQSAESPGP